MRIMKLVNDAVAIMILTCIVFGLGMAMINCILRGPVEEHRDRMEPTLEIYRAFNLNPSTVRVHNAEMEQQARAQYERQARGGQ